MTPIETFALIVILAALIKIIVIAINPKTWVGFAKKVYANTVLVMIIGLILAAVVLYYLIQEITILQIFGVMLFIALIAMMGVAVYAKEVMPVIEKIIKEKNFMKRAWLPILIWIILLIWAIIEIFRFNY